MTKGERAGYAVVCALVADFIVAGVTFWISPPADPHHWYGFLGLALLMLLGAVPGGFLLAGLTLVTGRQRGFDGVIFFFAGCLIGPVLLNLGHPSDIPLNPWVLITAADPLTRLATAISVLTTVLYLALSEVMERRRIQAKRHDR